MKWGTEGKRLAEKGAGEIALKSICLSVKDA
jgi:hypothetical protein